MGVSAVTEKDVMREGEGEKGKRWISLEQHVGCLDSKKKQWRDSTGDNPLPLFWHPARDSAMALRRDDSEMTRASTCPTIWRPARAHRLFILAMVATCG
jgi:hypothetical protein